MAKGAMRGSVLIVGHETRERRIATAVALEHLRMVDHLLEGQAEAHAWDVARLAVGHLVESVFHFFSFGPFNVFADHIFHFLQPVLLQLSKDVL